jgi:hypothetical protein
MSLSQAQAVPGNARSRARAVVRRARLGLRSERSERRTQRTRHKPHRQECLCYQRRKIVAACVDDARRGGKASGPATGAVASVVKTRATAARRTEQGKIRTLKCEGCGTRPTRTRPRGTQPARTRRRGILLKASLAVEAARRKKEICLVIAPAADCVCSFGATRVGSLIERVRLHVTTDRFLAQRRGDAIWEAACDYAALALTRLASRLRPTVLTQWICATAGAGGSAPPKADGYAAHRGATAGAGPSAPRSGWPQGDPAQRVTTGGRR